MLAKNILIALFAAVAVVATPIEERDASLEERAPDAEGFDIDPRAIAEAKFMELRDLEERDAEPELEERDAEPELEGRAAARCPLSRLCPGNLVRSRNFGKTSACVHYSNGANCVYLYNHNGKRNYMYLGVSSGQKYVSDSGNFKSYAGPVTIRGTAHKCITVSSYAHGKSNPNWKTACD